MFVADTKLSPVPAVCFPVCWHRLSTSVGFAAKALRNFELSNATVPSAWIVTPAPPGDASALASVRKLTADSTWLWS